MDGDVLRSGGRTTGAAYLYGYAIELHLKALILSTVVEHRQLSHFQEFRGRRAHDFTWLRDVDRSLGGASALRGVIDAFLILDYWDPKLRYDPSTLSVGDLTIIRQAVAVIMTWVEARL